MLAPVAGEAVVLPGRHDSLYAVGLCSKRKRHRLTGIGIPFYGYLLSEKPSWRSQSYKCGIMEVFGLKIPNELVYPCKYVAPET